MSIYRHLDYRLALREVLDFQKKSSAGGGYAAFAEVIGVQKTFVSKVLNCSAHLSDDQFYLTSQYLGLSSQENRYFTLIYHYTRSGLHVRQKEILREIKDIQEEQRQFRMHTKAEMHQPETTEMINELYLDPLNLLVHAYLGIKKYQDNPEEMANALDISLSQLTTILNRLQRMEIIKILKSPLKVKVLKQALHLDIRSIYCRPYQMLFRIKSNEQVMKLSPEQRFVLTLTFSGDHQVKSKIQELYLKFMKEVEHLLDGPHGDDDVYQINFDLFPWGKRSD